MSSDTYNVDNAPNEQSHYCGRIFTESEIEWIRHLIAGAPQLNRAQLSLMVCKKLGWVRLDGRSKEMSCRVALASRDQSIFWDLQQRKSNLHLIVNNARFLILPWGEVQKFVSHVLAKMVRRLPQDVVFKEQEQ